MNQRRQSLSQISIDKTLEVEGEQSIGTGLDKTPSESDFTVENEEWYISQEHFANADKCMPNGYGRGTVMNVGEVFTFSLSFRRAKTLAKMLLMSTSDRMRHESTEDLDDLLYFDSKAEAAACVQATLSVPAAEARPWSAESPALYTLLTTLTDGTGRELEVLSQRVGLRTVVCVLCRGVCRACVTACARANAQSQRCRTGVYLTTGC